MVLAALYPGTLLLLLQVASMLLAEVLLPAQHLATAVQTCLAMAVAKALPHGYLLTLSAAWMLPLLWMLPQGCLQWAVQQLLPILLLLRAPDHVQRDAAHAHAADGC
jgi:hypothetical protein